MKKICKNCGATVEGKYCPECGQAASVERIAVKEAVKGIYIVFSQTDSTFYRTVHHLITRPGHMVREYLIGERVKYLKPISMLTALVAAYLIITNFVLPEEAQEDAEIANAFNELTFLGSAKTSIIHFLQNMVYISLLQAFLLVIPFTFVFRKNKIMFKDGSEDSLNLAEHFYTIVYVSCFAILLEFICIPIRLLTGFSMDDIDMAGGLLYVGLYTWFYKQLLDISWLKSLWKVVLGMTLMLSAFIVLVAVIVAIAATIHHNIRV